MLHAVVGAIVLDQGGLEDALALVRDHVVDCATLQFPGEVDGKAVLALDTNVANVLSALPTARCALNNLALVPPPPPVGTDAGPEDLLLQEQQLQKVLNFSDVYLLEVSGELLLGSSPRSLLLRAPFMHQDLEPLEALEALEEQPQPTDPPTNRRGWVWCDVCRKWLNSLKQYESEKGHVQGKKHKNKLKKK